MIFQFSERGPAGLMGFMGDDLKGVVGDLVSGLAGGIEL